MPIAILLLIYLSSTYLSYYIGRLARVPTYQTLWVGRHVYLAYSLGKGVLIHVLPDVWVTNLSSLLPPPLFGHLRFRLRDRRSHFALR